MRQLVCKLVSQSVNYLVSTSIHVNQSVTQKSVSQQVSQLGNESVSQQVSQLTSHSFHQQASRIVSHSIRQASQLINQSISLSVNRKSVIQSVHKSVGQLVSQ